ncbi:MAG: 3-phosphoshikimate 1-carboxyvinyltransferase, partial [Candidatus Omnitrophica bacterium]|nr:3-phosphoshikimate 1-carboxyvinyltransferase [Candidatus Omnitrophota bacterium]
VEAAQGEKGEPVPPLKVFGRRPLRGIRYELPVPSAQVKSAILFAGLSAQKSTTIVEPRATRDHTERMLRAFGAVLLREGNGITLEPGKLSSPGTIHVPGDFSSALYFLVAAASIPGSRITVTQVSLNPTRTAALRILERMGAQVTFHLEASLFEPSGSITVEARPLRGVVITPEEVPGLIDELPILMVAASCAQGRTRIEGAGELRVKETDRIQSMVDGLSRMGASISTPDTDVVEITGGALKGASVSAAGDHRTAMSLAVAALLAEGETLIQSAECVSKSFPDFFERLAQVCGSDAVRKVDKP